MTKSKKTRRPSSSGTPRSYSEIYKNSTTLPADPTAAMSAAKSTVVSPAATPAGKTVDLSTEYAFVRKDMRDLMLVALAVFVGMVAVGFVLSSLS